MAFNRLHSYSRSYGDGSDIGNAYTLEEDSGVAFSPQSYGQNDRPSFADSTLDFEDDILNGYRDDLRQEATDDLRYTYPHVGVGLAYQDEPFSAHTEDLYDEIEQFSSSYSSADFSSPTPSQTHPRSQQKHASEQQSLHRGKYTQGNIRVRGAYIQHPERDSNRGNSGALLQKQDANELPPEKQGLRLRPVSDLPDMYRGIFKFGVFNAVQSKCYNTIMDTKENLIVSAPTGGGKTVIFELGILDMLVSSGHHSIDKCVYVAPTKALCSERMRDWTEKFEPLGIKCCELTGDTVDFGRTAWKEARTAKIIITTSEKWDSVTRSWHDHGEFLSEITLFLVDEVHVLNESRGSTLEVVISRMKAQGQNLRMILLSATVPNIRDIAHWIGSSSGFGGMATVFEFGEEYRPCKLTRHVYGYPRKNQNDFQFTRTLDFKLFSVLQNHACGKPILVFCSTRKGTHSTADHLLKEYEDATAGRQSTPWTVNKHIDIMFHDKRLEKLAKAGIGVHHAGLNFDDRRATEDLFLSGTLRIVCATSTLAVGVNLPAHTVVIKGVKVYASNAWQEYSDLDVIQMIGRAGRPQFDKEGVAIILCEQDLEKKYRNLAQGKTLLESSLHQNLLEHINSEIGMGAITDVEGAKTWLRHSFLRQRIERNPGHYHIGKSAGQTWEQRLDDMVMQSVKKLQNNELIEQKGDDEVGGLSATKFGDIMSKYYIRQTTMGMILNLPGKSSVRDILEVISCAEELGDVRLRGGDKQLYNKMRDHQDIRFKLKKIDKASDKVFVIIQAVLGGISLSAPEYKAADSQPALEALTIFRHCARIARVVVEVAIEKKKGAQLKHGLELVRCLTAKAWEDRPVVLKQVESIGEKSLKVLAENGITTVHSLRQQEPGRIEILLNRRPPFGHEILAFLQELPIYELSVGLQRNGITSYKALGKPKPRSKHKSRNLGWTNVLTTTSDLDFVDFRRISTKVLKETKTFHVSAKLSKPSQSIQVFISSEIFAGLTVMKSFKPSVPVTEFPTRDTHPQSEEQLLVQDLEEDPNFWDKMEKDDQSDLEDESGSKNVGRYVEPVPHGSPKARLVATSPKRLGNGNYACNHPCKDKQACRHLCCREGLERPPVAKKTTEHQKKDTATKACGKENDGAPAKKTTKSGANDAQLSKLEILHERSGVKSSLGLGDGRRLKLSNGRPPTRVEAQALEEPDFKINFTDITEAPKQDNGNRESSEELPNVQEVLAEHESQRRSKVLDAASDEYSDSEMDALMMAVDSTGAPQDGLGDVLPQCTFDDRIPALKHRLDDSPNHSSLGPKSPLTKRARLSSEPLFLHSSSLASSPIINRNGAQATQATDAYEHSKLEIDDFFSFDDRIFYNTTFSNEHNSDSMQASSSTLATNNETPSSTLKDFPVTKTATQPSRSGEVTATSEEKESGYDYDFMADLDEWIENSGCIRIVDKLE